MVEWRVVKMKIEVEKIMFDNNEEVQYKIVNVDECCDEILNNSDYVDISGDNYTEEIENDLDNYNVKISNSYETSNELIVTNYKTIKYCPFCGEKIEIIIVNTVDKNEEYNKLQKERDRLNDKRRNTDSKKEEQELNEIIYNLDNKINSFYDNDDFESYLKRIGEC